MKMRGHPFAKIFAGDAVLRTAYQMGKTPVLPIFAANLGAGEILLGLIVGISTLTGIIIKPIVGFLSDISGRKIWLVGAGILFVILPFFYLFVKTPEELMVLRLFHGISTAILGPVSLAYVVEISKMAQQGVGKPLGFFGMARQIGYLVGPLVSSYLVIFVEIPILYAVTGVIAVFGVMPLIALRETERERVKVSWGMSPAILVAGGLEMGVNMAIYAVKAFLPLYIVANGSILLAGAFFSIQEGVHMVVRPFGGMAADRFGRLPVIGAGLLVLAGGLFSLPYMEGASIIAAAIAIGTAQGLIFPASVAFVADRSGGSMGTGMGLYGALRNLGKVAGPVLAGVILAKYT